MPRSDRFINFGIDHGTSNSAIAVMEEGGPRVISASGFEPTMPSAVYIGKNGRVIVGSEARKSMIAGLPGAGDGHTGYKPFIGQDGRYDFPASRKVFSAPELGAHVLGALLKAYREETNESPRAAVITVPAMFKRQEREGTREAARRAGLEHVEMPLEPVAAALAYGHTANEEKVQWIIFDLGAGTLDVSLVLVRNGDLIIPEKGNEGDNHLGGSLFDRDLMDFVLGPPRSASDHDSLMRRYGQLQADYEPLRKLFKLEAFNEKSNQQAWGRLLLAVEEAKIELSDKKDAVVEAHDLMRDEAGHPVNVEFRITRTAYERIIAPYVERAVAVCQNLLRRNRLTARDISSMILVGGPTKTPYIQTMLRERVNIELKTDVNPMTAVALGAAIYGSKQEIPAGLRKARVSTPSGAKLSIEFEPNAKQPRHFVAGKVEGEAVGRGGLTVEIRRRDGLWQSGPIEVDAQGVFTAEVLLIEAPNKARTLSIFETLLRDAEDNLLDRLEEPSVWYPMGETVMAVPNSYMVALEGNETQVLVPAGSALPIEVDKGPFYTAKLLNRGSGEDVLRIPILEGVTNHLGEENELADCNLHIGTLIIEGNDSKVTRDVPIGSEVELNLKVDRSQRIVVVAEIPVLDQEFDATFPSEPTQVPVEAIRLRLVQLQGDLKKMRALEKLRPQKEVGELLERLDRIDCVAHIETQLRRAEEGERNARHVAYQQMLKLAGTLRAAGKRQIRVRMENLAQEIEALCDAQQKRELHELRAALDAIGPDDHRAMQNLERSFSRLELEVRRRPCMELLLDVIALSGRRVSKPQHELFNKAERLVKRYMESEEGRELSSGEIDEMRTMHEELLRAHDELPKWRKEKLDEFGGDPAAAARTLTKGDLKIGA